MADSGAHEDCHVINRFFAIGQRHLMPVRVPGVPCAVT